MARARAAQVQIQDQDQPRSAAAEDGVNETTTQNTGATID